MSCGESTVSASRTTSGDRFSFSPAAVATAEDLATCDSVSMLITLDRLTLPNCSAITGCTTTLALAT